MLDGNDAYTRRTLMCSGALVGAAAVASGSHPGEAVAQPGEPDPLEPVPLPVPVPVTAGLAQLDDTRLSYWDTGGEGQAIVLMHPATGTEQIWPYQQQVFAKAGYRVIAYSRRGYHKSDPVPQANPGSAAGDLEKLTNFLGVKKFHAVASAAGVSITLDYALSYPDKLHSMVLACGASGGMQEPEFLKLVESLRPKGFDDMPGDFRELGPWYRAANPEGARIWLDLEHRAITGNRRGQRPLNKATWSRLRDLKVPTLVMAGGADLYAPPPTLRIYANHFPDSEFLIVKESGHSIYWEQPDVFNRAVLDFIGRHRG
jgi:pimeloyl-ACP methyl ester carboxylesterase